MIIKTIVYFVRVCIPIVIYKTPCLTIETKINDKIR